MCSTTSATGSWSSRGRVVARLVVVGGGRMGEALLAGLLAAGWAAPDIAVVEVAAERRDELGGRSPASTVAAEVGAGRRRGGRGEAGRRRRRAAALAAAGVGRVLSIAAGVTIAALEAALGDGRRRWCGPCRTRRRSSAPGAAPSPAGGAAGDDDLAWAERSSAPSARSCACPRRCSTP